MPPARRPRLVLFAPLAVALVALGCVAAPRDPAGAPAGPAATRPASPSSQDPDGTDTPEEFQRDIASAQRIAEQYWSGKLKGFQPVKNLIPYEREGEVDCGGQPLGLNNAAYCSAGDFIAYDVNWSFAAFRQIGDAFLFYLLGHEYAHAIQLRLGLRAQFTIEQELQADCMAGAYIGDSVRADRLSLQDGDLDELARGLEAVGDDPGQPWFAEGAHGTARQRTTEFNKGLEESLRPCNLS
jgi:hypothetical protein